MNINCNQKLAHLSNIDVTNILIPGYVEKSDLCTSIGYFKSKIRDILFKLQKEGDKIMWDPMDRNFNVKFTEGPCWTWGLK